jgi:putative membrane protein
MVTLGMVNFNSLGEPLAAMVAFGLVGIGLMVLGFKIFDWLMPRIDVQKELAEKHNIAVGIVMAAVIIGVAVVVAAAMS